MSTFAEAQSYVGTDLVCGHAQLEILKREGLSPDCRVLELGCGCLSGGFPVMRYLQPGNYFGVEPNKWLIDAAMETDLIRAQSLVSKPRFLYRNDFDAREFGIKFDYIFGHSVLSHCGRKQVDQFLFNAEEVLMPKGRIVASLRLAEGNRYGSPGSPGHSDFVGDDWQYPGVAFYRQETICSSAYRCGLLAMLKPEHTAYLTSVVPKDFHDWMVFKRPCL